MNHSGPTSGGAGGQHGEISIVVALQESRGIPVQEKNRAGMPPQRRCGAAWIYRAFQRMAHCGRFIPAHFQKAYVPDAFIRAMIAAQELLHAGAVISLEIAKGVLNTREHVLQNRLDGVNRFVAAVSFIKHAIVAFAADIAGA